MRTFWHGPREERAVSLTFDDAPFEPHTSAILRTLDTYHIRATFFIVGKHARTWPRALNAILANGHEVGNHTEMHRPLTGLKKSVIETEILSLQAYLETSRGIRPRFFRPPEGKINLETLAILEDAGMDLVFWDVDPKDWMPKGFFPIARNIADRVRPGSILLLHTLSPQTLDMLPVLIEYLKTANYQIVPLSELLGRPAYQTILQKPE